MENSSTLEALLRARAGTFAPLLGFDLNGPHVTRLDFTAANPLLLQSDLKDTQAFEHLVHQMLQERNATVGVGGYFEHRVIYRRSGHFEGAVESRSVHLGVDLWAPAQTPVYAPLAGKVHSFKDNAHFGDYGPTILLEHVLEGIPFYTLYGHLSRASLCDLEVGKPFAAGEKIASFGPYPENGDWPPHLHFQLMANLQGKAGDFPGVCAPSEIPFFRQICLDPNLLLNCRKI